MDIEMGLSRIIIHEQMEQQIIVLKEKQGERSFPMVIGISEALAIDRRVKNIKTARPMTHQLINNILDALQVTLKRVIINDLRNQIFYACLVLEQGSKIFEVDCRPSDAVALAVAGDVPIFVSEHVLNVIT